MNVIYKNLDDEESEEESSNTEENDEDACEYLFPTYYSSVDFVKLYKNREGTGLFEPSLPRFPFSKKEAQDPSTKFSAIKDVENNFKAGKQFDEAMEGLTMSRAQVTFVETDKILFRGGYLSLTNKVKIISGGKGLFTDFVGRGMLSCAIIGTGGAPKSRVIFVAIRQLCKGDKAGVIALVPSNFEDELNWGIAIARALERGMNVALIPVSDAVSPTKRFPEKKALAGMLLYIKIAGAMSEENYSMREIYEKLQNLSLGTVSCHVDDCFRIFTDYEGLGGTTLPGVTKDEIINDIIRLLIDPKEATSLGYEPDSEFILLVNAYSGNWYFLQEIAAEATKQLQEKKIPLVLVFTGFYISTPNLGFSITLLAEVDNNLIKWLNSYTSCPGWTFPGTGVASISQPLPSRTVTKEERISDDIALKISSFLHYIFSQAAKSEETLNEIDSEREYGTKFSQTCQLILKGMESKELDPAYPHGLFIGISEYFYKVFNNRDGIMYATFFTGVAQAMAIQDQKDVDFKKFDKKIFIAALKNGISQVESYFMVDMTDGTIIDVFGPLYLLLKAAKFENSMVKGIDIALHIALGKYMVTSECIKKVTVSPQATVYSAYVLTSAFVNHFKTELGSDTDYSRRENIIKSEFNIRFGGSISNDINIDYNNKPTKNKIVTFEGNKTSVKRVAEKGDIFGIN